MKDRHAEAIRELEAAIRLQPCFAAAYYRFEILYNEEGKPEAARRAREEFARIYETGTPVRAGGYIPYRGRVKYTQAIAGTAPPGKGRERGSPGPVLSFKEGEVLSLGAAIERICPDGRRLPPSFAGGDIEGDGTLELVFCGQAPASTGESPHMAVYGLSDAGKYQLRQRLPDAVLCAMGDLDNDGVLEVVAAVEDGLSVFRRGPGGLLEAVNPETGKPEAGRPEADPGLHRGVPVRMCCGDLDHDGDLDLVCLRQRKREAGEIETHLEVLENPGNSLEYRKAPVSLGPFDFGATEMIVGDMDGDIDADLLLFDGRSGACRVFDNHRGWRFVEKEPPPGRAPGLLSVATGDLDGDGDIDIVLFSEGGLRFWRNRGLLRFEEDAAFGARHAALGGASGVFTDVAGELSGGLVILEPKGLARVAGSEVYCLRGPEARVEAVPLPLSAPRPGGAPSAFVAHRSARAPPELFVYGSMGARSFGMESGGEWLGIGLRGTLRPKANGRERANWTGIGCRIEVFVASRSRVLQTDPHPGGTARPPAVVSVSLGAAPEADLVRILWPDAVLQAEISVPGGQVHTIQETQRLRYANW